MHFKFPFPLLIIALLSIGCGYQGSSSSKPSKPKELPPRDVHPFTVAIEEAHQAQNWFKHEAMQFEFAMRFGDNTLLAEVTMDRDFGRVKFVTDKQESIVWDGEKLFLSPADAEWSNPRFDIFTWPYFFAVPFKLNDPGTRLDSLGKSDQMGEAAEVIKLSFEEGVGDSPEDWYKVYRSDSSGLLVGMVYIVTYFSQDQAKSEANPHAISYHNFAEFDGIKIPTEWRFWDWSDEEGLGKRRGTARVGNFKFIKPSRFTYSIPISNREGE